MKTPQILAVILISVEAGLQLTKHGQPRDNYNFGVWLVSTLIFVGLLYWGGFFS